MFIQSLIACPEQVSSLNNSKRMSSEEVAELAQAIHSHADALYESWTKGPDVMRRMEDTLELLADPGLTPKLEHLVSTFVRRDKAKRQQIRQHQSPPKTLDPSNEGELNLNGSAAALNKKPLPKSILAVVQRFEPSPERVKERAASPASDLVKVSLPGIGIVNKNVLWAESSNRQTVTEKTLARQTQPVANKTFAGNQGFLVNNQRSNLNVNVAPVTTNNVTTTRVVRERHIPIERCDRDDSPAPTVVEKNGPMRTLDPREKLMTIHLENPTDCKGAADIQELEREEEKLFRALRTGQVVPPGHGSSPTSLDLLREKATSPSNSRVAFAKERIRQSQEHPLTQQRLELQKRLPSPSGSLAAAIAVQQGKIKFQPHNHVVTVNGSQLEDEVGANKENGGGGGTASGGVRQGWVTTVLRFGPGSSVADRVQLFEKYPAHIVSSTNSTSTPNLPQASVASPKEGNSHWSRKQTTANNVSAPWRATVPSETHHQPDVVVGPKKQNGGLKSPVSTIKNTTRVPRFYWPEGKPPHISSVQQCLAKAEEQFAKSSGSVSYIQFGQLLLAIGIPFYWKKPFWMAFGLKSDDALSSKTFIPFYRHIMSEYPDDASRFMRILSTAARYANISNKGVNNNNNNNNKAPSVNHGKLSQDLKSIEISMSDFIPMIQDIIDTHPGLGFLRDAPEFHSRYVTTVISRIFYKVNRSWTGRISLAELRRSNLLRVIKRLEEETDVNTITEYFSYEHFYVIYCKFWELDKDHDLLIDKNDLAAHSDHALSSRIIDRIFSGTVIRGWDVASPVKCSPGKMTYSDFVWFLLSEEDKRTPTSIEYWFRCLDLDGDGILSPFELQFFYSEQECRIESLGIEPLDFSNIYCQIVDMLRCSTTGIRLRDLKQNPQLAANVFNTLFNLDKYLDHEQRDPFAAAASASSSHEVAEGESDWDKYAASEYELLIAEETPSDNLYNSDFEDNIANLTP